MRAITWEPNPILVKELRGRFRGNRAFMALTVFLVLLSIVAAIAYQTQMELYNYGLYESPYASLQYQPGMPITSRPLVPPDIGARIGRTIYGTVGVMELVLVAFIAPALAISAVSGEVERRTYELLLATPLSGRAIVWGKLGAALSFVAILIASALPVMSLAFVYGGVSARDIAVSQLAILVMGIELVAMGLFYSALLRRTTRAAVLSYATVGLLSVAPILLGWVSALVFMVRSGIGDGSMIATFFELSPLAPPLVMIMRVAAEGPWTDFDMFWAQSLLLHSVLGLGFIAGAGRMVRLHHRRRLGPVAILVVAGLMFWAAIVTTFPPLD
jgi:hypothetical protein